ncbi:SpoIIIAH-like family protein [Shouchella sp. 1P09AA]|uniref:SpoIIIAH-like family protein n=1 Tax=unclassified Shouchella TaxID=2893065 RepID=UPI0039A115ED
MVLKKQTVWLLTMLSLMLVLGAYYVINDSDDQASSGSMMDEARQIVDELGEEEGEDANDDLLSQVSGSDTMTEARLKRDEVRLKEAEQFSREASSEESSADEVVEANDRALDVLAFTDVEEQLEELIKEIGYSDALVMTADDKVEIMVQADALSKTEALTIMSLAREELSLTEQDQVLVKHGE